MPAHHACSQHLPGPGAGDASGGGGLRGGDPERLLHETRQILEPGCPGLRPLLRGLAGNRDSPPEGSASQPPPPPAAAPPVVADNQVVPVGPSSSDGGVTSAEAAVDQESAGSDVNVGFGSVLDYGGDGSLGVGGEPGRGSSPPSASSAVLGALEGADGLFKENGSAVASEASGGIDAAAGAREVFDRPVQSSGSSPLSNGRPQIV